MLSIALKRHTDFAASLWFPEGNRRFSRQARAIVEGADTISVVNAVCAGDLASKVRLGKWPETAGFARAFADILVREGFELLSITPEHASLAGSLPGARRYPLDRMLAPQTRLEGIPLVSADSAFRLLDTRTIW